MIERFYIKDHILFDEIELLFEPGLIVFTGPSGSGKSILFEAILAIFGLKSPDMSIGEMSITDPLDKEGSITFQYKKVNDKNRFFVNRQSIAKKELNKEVEGLVSFLHVQDLSDFHSDALLLLLDSFIAQKDKTYRETLQHFKQNYSDYQEQQKALQALQTKASTINEQQEFLRYEIDKIDKIDPKAGEYDELMRIKKNLSQTEKIGEQISKIDPLLSYQGSIEQFLQTISVDSGFCDDFFIQLSDHIAYAHSQIDTISQWDIERVLNRLAQLSELIKRYGSVEEALEEKRKKQKELQAFEEGEFNEKALQKKCQALEKEVQDGAKAITKRRNNHLQAFTQTLSTITKKLYLGTIHIELQDIPLYSLGGDELSIGIDSIPHHKLSSGETNRLRLALLTLKNRLKSQSGVLILDEIDANLSGVESESVAEVLYEIAQHYQIFSISHQPHLTSFANQHFLVQKKDKKSSITMMRKKGDRIKEIARMLSGKHTSKTSLELATQLLDNRQK